MDMFIRPDFITFYDADIRSMNHVNEHGHHPRRAVKKNVYGKDRVHQYKGLLSEVNTADPLYRIKNHMNGEQEAVYHVNFLKLLDDVFLFDAMKVLSTDQQRFISKFFNQAHTVTEKMKKGEENPYEDLDHIFRQLDNFLGSYFGVDYDRFAR